MYSDQSCSSELTENGPYLPSNYLLSNDPSSRHGQRRSSCLAWLTTSVLGPSHGPSHGRLTDGAGRHGEDAAGGAKEGRHRLCRRVRPKQAEGAARRERCVCGAVTVTNPVTVYRTCRHMHSPTPLMPSHAACTPGSARPVRLCLCRERPDRLPKRQGAFDTGMCPLPPPPPKSQTQTQHRRPANIQSFIGWIGEEKYQRLVNYMLIYLANLKIPKKRSVQRAPRVHLRRDQGV